jgi:hypothetical protein
LLLMNLMTSSQYLTAAYIAWSGVADIMTLLRFDTQQILTMYLVFGDGGRLLLMVLLACSQISFTSHLLPRLPFFHFYQILIAYIFQNISTYCSEVYPALSRLSHASKCLNVAKTSATTIC